MFKKKEKTEKAPKNKKVRTMKVGTHKKSVPVSYTHLDVYKRQCVSSSKKKIKKRNTD